MSHKSNKEKLVAFSQERGWVPFTPKDDAYVCTPYEALWMRPVETELTGRRTTIAIVDQPLWTSHPAYAQNIIDLEYIDLPTSAETKYHGASVASIAVGEIGIARRANLVYRAYAQWGDDTSLYTNHRLALESLKRYVQRGNRLDAISSSLGWQAGAPEAARTNALIGWFEDRSIPVFTVNEIERYASVCGPTGAPVWLIKNIQKAPHPEKALAALMKRIAIPVTNRALACYCKEQKDFLKSIYYKETLAPGGISWAVPFIAGLFAAKREAFPDITKEDFIACLSRTTQNTRLGNDVLRTVDLKKFLSPQ